MIRPCRIELLGGLRIQQEDRMITRFRTRHTAALLGYLACHPGRATLRETLIEMLWPDFPAERGRNNLSISLGSLRHHLEPPGTPAGAVLQADRFQVSLHPQAIGTDVAEFETLLSFPAGEDEAEHARRLKEALALYRGELLPGYDQEWILPERRRLADAFQQALRWLVRRMAQNGDLPAALDYARRAVTADPLSEESHRDLMRLYVASRLPSAALQQYRELEALLLREMNLRPSAATQRLARDIQARIQGQENPASLPVRRLPMQFTRFFGRAEEIARLLALLAPAEPFSGISTMVTLTGMGGSGKTRLAQETAQQVPPAFFGLIIFVPLADINDARLIPEAVLHALQEPSAPQKPPLEQIVERLSSQPSLLILDNFEPLLEEGAALIQTLRERIPSLSLLITSRQALGLPGEREFILMPLAAPGQKEPPETLCLNPSVQLFVDRAQAVRPDFQITPHNASSLALLCARLEGLPLAIELAAVRAGVMAPAQILAQLEQRFDLLVRKRRDGPDRHRTMRAAIEWSYLALPLEMQRFFARLSVFRGGWTPEDAEPICLAPIMAAMMGNAAPQGSPPQRADCLDCLEYLRQCSLLFAEEKNDRMRFRMLETLREYAAEQLSEPERRQGEERHALHYLALVEEATPYFQKGQQRAAYQTRLEAEYENLRAAMEWTLRDTSRVEVALQMTAGLYWFWDMTARMREGSLWLKRALAAVTTNSVPPLRARALRASGMLAWRQERYAEAWEALQSSLAIWQTLQDRQGIAADSTNLGLIALAQCDFLSARILLGNGLTISRELDNRFAMAVCCNALGEVAEHEGDLHRAQDNYEQSCALFREMGHRVGLAAPLYNLSVLALNRQDYVTAFARLHEHLALCMELKNEGSYPFSLEGFAGLALAAGEWKKAALLFSAATALRESIGSPLPPPDREKWTENLQQIREHLGEVTFLAAQEQGNLLTMEQALAFLPEKEA